MSLWQVDELDLRDEMLVVLNSHPVARNRYLYVGGNLHALPNSMSLTLSDVFVERCSVCRRVLP